MALWGHPAWILRTLKIARSKMTGLFIPVLRCPPAGGQGKSGKEWLRFEVALKSGKASDWYDDALYHYAEWSSWGRFSLMMDNGVRQDFVKALVVSTLGQRISKRETYT
jgi:hypothetical protein